MDRLQKMGGIAALAHAGAYVAGIALFLSFAYPALNAGTGQYLAFVAGHQSFMRLTILISYWLSAIALVFLALALYHRLKAGSPILAQAATIFGLIWIALIIGSGNLMLYDFGVLAKAYAQDPGQAATAWLALEAVENGLVSGNELVGSLWVLLLSIAALRTGLLPRALSIFGLALGAVGILTLVPALTAALGTMPFGLGMIAWCLWLGVFLLRSGPAPIQQGYSLSLDHGGLRA